MIEIKEIIIDNLNEEARIWKKNCETVCDIVALYDILSKTWRGIALKTIILKVVEDLEDKENYIPYKIDNGKVYDLIKMIEAKRKEIEEKYKEDFDKDYLRNVLSVEREFDYCEYLSLNNGGIEKYNIIKKVTEENDEKIELFLDSDIDFEIRKEMFKEFMYSARRNESISELLMLDHRKGIRELTKWFDDATFEKMKFIEHTIEEDEYDKFTEVSGFINLYNFNWMYTYQEGEENKKMGVSMPAIFASKKLSIPKEIYSDPSYQALDHKIKNNTDMVILSKLVSDMIPSFIEYDEFEINKEKLTIICNRTLDVILKAPSDEQERIYMDTLNAVLKKTKDKKEYREYLNYYEEHVDYKKVLEERNLEKERLISTRKSLVKTLSVLNDTLQEEVPGKRLIKDLNFKKED